MSLPEAEGADLNGEDVGESVMRMGLLWTESQETTCKNS
ncbi:hypothetical protein KR52_12080 [Synechococcus sp. KORDI-52]|nr:hypothetical protein KR52_12080 [Synechococcus sp. KORDI-52]